MNVRERQEHWYAKRDEAYERYARTGEQRHYDQACRYASLGHALAPAVKRGKPLTRKQAAVAIAARLVNAGHATSTAMAFAKGVTSKGSTQKAIRAD